MTVEGARTFKERGNRMTDSLNYINLAIFILVITASILSKKNIDLRCFSFS